MAELLIVDDNSGLRDGMSEYFSSKGHHLQTAEGVASAMERIQDLTPDVVLSDLVMEDGTGLGLRQQIRQLGLAREPFFILLTAHPSLDNAREAYRDGVDLYLTKPFQMPALALAVDNALRQQALTRSHELAGAAEAVGGQRVRAQADAFYHEFFLTLNPVLPRLLLLLEGRYGGLRAEQLACVSSIFDTWRKLVWTMAAFHERLAQVGEPGLVATAWNGPQALRRVLDSLEPDLAVCQLATETKQPPQLPQAKVHAPTAEALLAAAVLRLAAFSAPKACLTFSWEAKDGRLELMLGTSRSHPELTPELMRHVSMLPPLLPQLEQAGVEIRAQDHPGPWVMTFDPA